MARRLSQIIQPLKNKGTVKSTHITEFAEPEIKAIRAKTG